MKFSKDIIMRYIVIMLIMSVFGFTSCVEEEKHEPLAQLGLKPRPLIDVAVNNQNGRATIYYTIQDTRALYVLAEYRLNENGEVKQIKSSKYKDYLEVEGFPAAGDYEVKLYAVSADEIRSEPVVTTVSPEIPPYELAFESLDAIAGFGAVNIKAENVFSNDLVFEILVKNSDGDWINWDACYTSLPSVFYTSSNLEEDEYEMGFYVRDKWQNLSDTLFRVIRPLREEKIDLKTGGYLAYWLPTDIQNANPPLEPGWYMDRLFDGSLTATPFFKNKLTEVPWHFSIDLKQAYALSKVKVFQRINGGTPYGGANIKKFKIWGSNNPNPNGSFDSSWILLGEFENIKPSGAPVGSNSSQDIETATNGEVYYFDPNGVSPTAPIRYLRFQFIENWGGNTNLHMQELEIYGALQ